MDYVTRTLEPRIAAAAATFPVVLLTGPRQAGKTTLLRHVLDVTHRYVSLDDLEQRELALQDPRRFLATNPPPVIVDEIQHAPDLLSYVKLHVDEHRDAYGAFVLSGSQNLLLSERVSESLAGRVAVLDMFPMTYHERTGRPFAAFPWSRGDTLHARAGHVRAPTPDSVWEDLLRGGFPELVARPQLAADEWFGNYVRTYLERDVRMVRQVGDLREFQQFLGAIAARSAQLVNLSDLAQCLGIAVNTAKRWLSVLDATYVATLVRPYGANATRRIVKTPKVFLRDTGLLCWLVGIYTADHAMRGPMSGAIFETAVMNELMHHSAHLGERARFCYWRTSHGLEVDVVVDQGMRIVPVEAKASATVRQRMARGIEAMAASTTGSVVVEPGYVVHMGEATLAVGPAATALPWGSL